MGMHEVVFPAWGCCRTPSPISGAEALRLHGQYPHRKPLRSPKTLESRKGPSTEMLPTAAHTLGVVRGSRRDRMALGPPLVTGTPLAIGPM